MAFCCFWLVVSYRQDAATAVVWRYGPEISAIACSLLAFITWPGTPSAARGPIRPCFFCACGAFLCFTALPDSRLMALQLLLAGSALMQLFFLASLAANLRRAPEAVPREAEEEPDAPAAQPPEEFGTLDDALRAEREDEEFAGSFVEYDPGEPRQKKPLTGALRFYIIAVAAPSERLKKSTTAAGKAAPPLSIHRKGCIKWFAPISPRNARGKKSTASARGWPPATARKVLARRRAKGRAKLSY